MSQELERTSPSGVPEHLSEPGAGVVEAFQGAPIDARTWSMYAQIAKTIKGTDFVPEALRGSEAGILACMLYGDSQGLHPMVALAEISMIDGKPAMSAELMVAKIRAAGHSIQREELLGDANAVVGIRAHGERFDNGDQDTFTFTLDMARRAGLLSKRNWQNYPEAMLWARAASQIARQLFSDVFLGLSVYVPDELGDDAQEVTDAGLVDTERSDAQAEAEEGEAAAPETDEGAGAAPDETAGVEEEGEVAEAARVSLEEAFPVPLTRNLIEACDSKAELLALCERYGIDYMKRDPIAELTRKLMAHVKANAASDTDTVTGEPESLTLPAVEGDGRDEDEVADEARHDAFLGRVRDVLAWVGKNHPDSPLTEQRILDAASSQFDRPIEDLAEMTADELDEIWQAIPQQARDAIVQQS